MAAVNEFQGADVETRENVWKRLNGEAMSPVLVPPSYFEQVTRKFNYESQIDSSDFPNTKLHWAWDVIQGHVAPMLVVVRVFGSKREAEEASKSLLEIERLGNERLRKMLCYTEPCAAFNVGLTHDEFRTSHVFVSATELPPIQHSVDHLAADHTDDAKWIGSVLSGVEKALQDLNSKGATAVVNKRTVFLRGGKESKVYLTRIRPHTPQEVPVEQVLRSLREEIAAAGGLEAPSFTMCVRAIDVDGVADANAMFDEDELDTPLMFEQVGNCPIVLREKCVKCSRLVKSAGFHMRGADCSVPVRHFACEGCVNERFEANLASGVLTLDTLPCLAYGCPGSMHFDDYGALIKTAALRKWNRLGRERALKEVEEDVNKRLGDLVKRATGA